MTTAKLTSICVCPQCRGDLGSRDGRLWCSACGGEYPLVDDIPVMLPPYADADRREAYRRNYERIAEDDLRSPLVPNRFDLMHRLLVDFIGDVRGQNVLDVGSAYGSYLTVLDARLRVAVDLAMPYLREIPRDSGIVRICGDAEYLPVRPELFDVIVISDVLEHLLTPESLVNILAAALPTSARVIVHVPWRESLEQYADSPYDFVHLRTFDDFTFRNLFWAFDVRRERSSLPLLTEPAVFRLRRFLPRRAFETLSRLYFGSELSEVDAKYRERWGRELPRRERWLLKLYPPQVKLFELRRRDSLDYADRGLARNVITDLMARWLSRVSADGRPTGAAREHVRS